MSIDSLIDDKKDAMQLGGQPLNQGVGPDLIEVLATRKLLEEKATIARDLALKQQPIPNTIAEQQDQKLLGLTQKEIATQTGGILANRAQQQGKPQPRPQQGGIMGAMGGGKPPMPQGAPRPPMGGMGGAPRPPMGGAPRPPMGGAPRPPMGGIAGAAPRPPMMASGGIVGYNVGGKVKSAEEAVRALGLVDDPTSPAHQAKLQKIMQTLTAQSSPEEKAAVQKVLTEAGLETGEVGQDTVGFNKGGLNDAQRRAKEYQESKGGRMVEALTEALKRRGLTHEQFEALSPNEKQAIRTELPQIMQEQKQGRDNYMSPIARLKDATSPQALAEKRDNAQKKIMKANNPEMFAQTYPEEVKPTTAELDTSALATPNTFNDTAKPSTADMGGLGVLRPQAGPQAPMGGGKPPMPQAGAGKEFDLSVDPSEFSSTSVSDSMNPQMKKQLDRRLALEPKTAADEERTAAMGRYKVDETTSGLQDILDRQLAESRRVADDPQAKYKRDKASIYAARAGAPGRAYQQRVLGEQGKEGKLIAQELNNFATAANTEAALITKVDAEAGKAATLAANSLSEAMKVASTFTVADQQALREMVANRGTQLKGEAELKLKNDYNLVMGEAKSMTELIAVTNAMSSIIAAEITQLQNSQKYMAEGTEGRAELEKTLQMEQFIKYIYPQQAIMKRITGALDIDLGDSGASGGSEVDLTDEEAAAMAQ